MRSGAFKNLCHIQIYTVKWTYEPIWESIFSVFWASGVLKSIFPDLSAPKEARETKKIHLKFFIQKGLPPTWETTVLGSGGWRPILIHQLSIEPTIHYSLPHRQCLWLFEKLLCWWCLSVPVGWGEPRVELLPPSHGVASQQAIPGNVSFSPFPFFLHLYFIFMFMFILPGIARSTGNTWQWSVSWQRLPMGNQ